MRNIQQTPLNKPEVPVELRLSMLFWEVVRMWVGRVLLALGLVFLAGYATARIESWFGARMLLKEFAALEASTATAKTNHADGSDSEVSVRKSTPAVNAEEAPSVRSATPLGVLTIPGIHLTAPLLEGTDDLTLNHAVGRIAGTALPGEKGNIGIAGHRDGIFRGLQRIKKGDVIELKTLKSTDTYIVEQIHIVNPDGVSVLKTGSTPALTLVTCYPFYFIGSAPKRFIVKASLTQPTGSGPSGLAVRAAVTTM